MRLCFCRGMVMYLVVRGVEQYLSHCLIRKSEFPRRARLELGEFSPAKLTTLFLSFSPLKIFPKNSKIYLNSFNIQRSRQFFTFILTFFIRANDLRGTYLASARYVPKQEAQQPPQRRSSISETRPQIHYSAWSDQRQRIRYK